MLVETVQAVIILEIQKLGQKQSDMFFQKVKRSCSAVPATQCLLEVITWWKKRLQEVDDWPVDQGVLNFRETHVPSGYVKIAIENTTFIADLPIKDGGSFH